MKTRDQINDQYLAGLIKRIRAAANEFETNLSSWKRNHTYKDIINNLAQIKLPENPGWNDLKKFHNLLEQLRKALPDAAVIAKNKNLQKLQLIAVSELRSLKEAGWRALGADATPQDWSREIYRTMQQLEYEHIPYTSTEARELNVKWAPADTAWHTVEEFKASKLSQLVEKLTSEMHDGRYRSSLDAIAILGLPQIKHHSFVTDGSTSQEDAKKELSRKEAKHLINELKYWTTRNLEIFFVEYLLNFVIDHHNKEEEQVAINELGEDGLLIHQRVNKIVQDYKDILEVINDAYDFLEAEVKRLNSEMEEGNHSYLDELHVIHPKHDREKIAQAFNSKLSEIIKLTTPEEFEKFAELTVIRTHGISMPRIQEVREAIEEEDNQLTNADYMQQCPQQEHVEADDLGKESDKDPEEGTTLTQDFDQRELQELASTRDNVTQQENQSFFERHPNVKKGLIIAGFVLVTLAAVAAITAVVLLTHGAAAGGASVALAAGSAKLATAAGASAATTTAATSSSFGSILFGIGATITAGLTALGISRTVNRNNQDDALNSESIPLTEVNANSQNAGIVQNLRRNQPSVANSLSAPVIGEKQAIERLATRQNSSVTVHGILARPGQPSVGASRQSSGYRSRFNKF